LRRACVIEIAVNGTVFVKAAGKFVKVHDSRTTPGLPRESAVRATVTEFGPCSSPKAIWIADSVSFCPGVKAIAIPIFKLGEDPVPTAQTLEWLKLFPGPKLL
jgi:hypothetical protein